jgi:hypothetical protein
MVIAIRKEPNGLIYIDKNIYASGRFSEGTLSQPPYNYTKVVVDDKYADCESSDFNNDLTFGLDKYQERKTKQDNLARIAEIQSRLTELSQDIVQADLGANFGTTTDENGNTVDIFEQKRAEFISLHNELRGLLGKEPRVYD